jgi:uncharacterized protein (TIGR03435 family)
MIQMRFALSILLLFRTSAAQEPSVPRFEVASVRYVGSFDDASTNYMRGGPGTPDPERIMWRQQLPRLLLVAYGVDFDQISGPKWLATETYEIQVKIPQGSTKEQVREMWKGLLQERFGLKAHMIRREFPGYELTLPANGKIKLQRSQDEYRPEPGFPAPAEGKKWGVLTAPPRNVRQTFRAYTMDELAQRLAWPLGTMADTGGMTVGRVVNKTGLDGTFDFTLEYAGAWGPGGASMPDLPDGQADTAPPLFDAVRQQLGLLLRQTNIQLDVLVVDEISRMPSEN